VAWGGRAVESGFVVLSKPPCESLRQIPGNFPVQVYIFDPLLLIISLALQAMPEKYRRELLHIKMLEALEMAQMGDRFDWLRVASFAGTIFDPRVSFDRSPVDGANFFSPNMLLF
jgi:hypothetical protein